MVGKIGFILGLAVIVIADIYRAYQAEKERANERANVGGQLGARR